MSNARGTEKRMVCLGKNSELWLKSVNKKSDSRSRSTSYLEGDEVEEEVKEIARTNHVEPPSSREEFGIN